MSNTNPAPAAGNDGPLSFDDGVDALADVLKDPETDLAEEDQAQEQEASEETEAEGDEPEAEETEEATEEEATEEED